MTGLLEKEKEKRIRLRELGIDYDFGGFKAIIDEAMNKKIVVPEEKATPKKEKS